MKSFYGVLYVRISLELLWGVKRDGRLVDAGKDAYLKAQPCVGTLTWHPDLVPAQIAIDT